MPVTDEFVAAAGRDPRRPALTIGEAVDLDRAALDYGTLIARAWAVAHALPALLDGRLEAGRTRIALLATDNAPFVPIFLGILLAGATAVILDPKWTAGERHRALKAARPDLLVADAAIADAGVATVAAADLDLARPRPGAPAAPVPGDDAPFLITFTAGTTAAPKGLIRSHRSWRASLAAARQAFPIVCGDAVLIPGPLAHSVSLFALVEALSAGAHVHLLSRFDAATVLATLARHPISRLTAVPTMYAAIAAKAEAGAHGRRFAGVTALVSAGSKLEPGLREDLARVFPLARIVEYYGASELSFVAFGAADDGCPASAVGRPFPGVHVRIRDRGGRDVEPGRVGRLWVRSPMLASGYLEGGDGDALHDAEGWATVGDHARLDADGWIHLVGRDQGMLVSGGLNIYPAEVEAVLRDADAVAEALVLGLPDLYWGECVVAIVSPRPGRRPARATLLAHCRQRLAVYKCPKRFFLVDAMPMTPSGKVARGRLRRMLLAEAASIAELVAEPGADAAE